MAKTTISLDWISKYGDVSSKHFGKMRIQWEYHGTLLHIIASSPMVLDGFNLKFLAWWQHLWRIKRMGKHQGDCTSTQIQIVPVAPGLTVLDTTIQVSKTRRPPALCHVVSSRDRSPCTEVQEGRHDTGTAGRLAELLHSGGTVDPTGCPIQRLQLG